MNLLAGYTVGIDMQVDVIVIVIDWVWLVIGGWLGGWLPAPRRDEGQMSTFWR
jgi:hypothetical protein